MEDRDDCEQKRNYIKEQENAEMSNETTDNLVDRGSHRRLISHNDVSNTTNHSSLQY